MLPAALNAALVTHLEAVHEQHQGENPSSSAP